MMNVGKRELTGPLETFTIGIPRRECLCHRAAKEHPVYGPVSIKGGFFMSKNPPLFFRAGLSADCRTLAKGRKVHFIPDGGAARAV